MCIYDSSLSVTDLARGYARRDTAWVCLLCGEAFEPGVVYTVEDRQYEAFRAVAEHVRVRHGSVFQHLLRSQEKYTGLTRHQAEVLEKMAAGMSDREIAEALSGSSNTAAVRNLRFQLKEKEKQAKAYLAVMEAFRLERPEPKRRQEARVPSPAGATMGDERFDVTEREREAVLRLYFTPDGSLREFPVREKRKLVVLAEIAGRFETGRDYTEKEVNGLIGYHDFATVRRYLVEYGFLTRSQDCGRYRRKDGNGDGNRELPQ